MFEKYQEEFKHNPIKFIIGLIIIFILAFVCIYQLRGYFTGIWPNKQSIENTKKQLLSSQQKLQEALNTQHKLLNRRESFINNSGNFWLSDRDGDATLNIQKKINKAAEDTEVVLSSVGAARTEKVTEGISLVSVSIRSKATLKNTAEFINEVEKLKPRAYWKSMVLRPENPRNPAEVVMSGNIVFITVTHQEALNLLQGKK